MIEESMLIGLLVGFCSGLMLMSVLCAFLAFFSYAKIVGFERSTHQIEYRETDFSGGADGEEDEDFDPFAEPDDPTLIEPLSGIPKDLLDEEKRKKEEKKETRELKEALVGEDTQENYQGF